MTVEDRQSVARDEALGDDIDQGTAHGGPPADRGAWSNLWQIPTLVTSVALIALALFLGRSAPDGSDVDAALAAVTRHVAEGRLEAAAAGLTDHLEPRIDTITREQRALYHALRADVIALAGEPTAASIAAAGAIADDYARAEAHGAHLEPAQIARWLDAHLVLGDVTAARRQWDDLMTRTRVDPAAGLPAWRMRQLERRLISCAFERNILDNDALAAMIDAYRRREGLAADDLAWIAMRRAELRTRAGDAAGAVDLILVAMRRIEAKTTSPVLWAELHAAIGAAYLADGRPDAATVALGEALDTLPELAEQRGRAMVTLADACVATDQVERAQFLLDAVIESFETPAVVEPARLARTHVRSELGDHAGSADDFRALCERIAVGGHGIDPDVVIARLVDRLDARLAARDLARAVAYLDAAAAGGPRVADDPAIVWSRAETYEAIAERDRADAPAADLVARHAIGRAYRTAADAYARHAELVATEAGETWADSTWRAADCYDHAGRRDLAIERFQTYIDERPELDPRRPAAMYRRAQALEADEDHESAAHEYETVIATYPRTPFATRSRVPLSRCYAALERFQDAEALLRMVVDGGVPALTPDAVDYQDALLALGRLHHDRARYAAAIECLDEALHRAPDDPRSTETRFLLAESHRRYGLELRERPVSARQRDAQSAVVRSRFEIALAAYEAVGVAYAARENELGVYEADLDRYAALYRGDCLFELERFDEAAACYDRAALRYREHPSSIHALVQIINCYDRLGDQVRADIAHRAALQRLQGLPDAAFDEPTVLMNRDAWERWLESRPIGLAQAGDGIESD